MKKLKKGRKKMISKLTNINNVKNDKDIQLRSLSYSSAQFKDL